MKKKVRLLSTMLVLFVLLHVFALNAFAIYFDTDSYVGMTGSLIPNWYWQYTGNTNVPFSYGTCTLRQTYITHFYSYSTSLSFSTDNDFIPGAYDFIVGPDFMYSRWWPSLGSDPSASVATYPLSSSTSNYIMTNNAVYNNVPLFSELHNSASLAFASFEYYVKNTSTNNTIVNNFHYTKHNSYG